MNSSKSLKVSLKDEKYNNFANKYETVLNYKQPQNTRPLMNSLIEMCKKNVLGYFLNLNQVVFKGKPKNLSREFEL